MIEIALTRNKIALISDHQYEKVIEKKWSAFWSGRKWYAYNWHGGKGLLLHRHIMDAPDDMQVDHRDGNGLNCVDENLRLCTPAQNMQNKTMYKNNTSGYKGVSWDAKKRKWKAQIGVNGHPTMIGRYNDVIMAALAYDEAARNLYGEFAKLNFPD